MFKKRSPFFPKIITRASFLLPATQNNSRRPSSQKSIAYVLKKLSLLHENHYKSRLPSSRYSKQEQASFFPEINSICSQKALRLPENHFKSRLPSSRYSKQEQASFIPEINSMCVQQALPSSRKPLQEQAPFFPLLKTRAGLLHPRNQ